MASSAGRFAVGFQFQALPAMAPALAAGLSPEEARAEGREIKTGLFPFRANGRAMTQALDDGFVRVVARADNHVLQGPVGPMRCA